MEVQTTEELCASDLRITESLIATSAALRSDLADRRIAAESYMNAETGTLLPIILAEAQSIVDAARAAKEQEENE